MLAGLAIDLGWVRRQPFAWVRRMRGASVRRVFLVHVTIVLGAVVMAWRVPPRHSSASSLCLSWLDVFAAFATDDVPDKPAAWITALFRRLDPPATPR